MTLMPGERQRLLVAIEQANQDSSAVGQTWAEAFSDVCRRARINEGHVSSVELRAIFKEVAARHRCVEAVERRVWATRPWAS